MSKLDELIEQYCPNGVEYKMLNNVALFFNGDRGKNYPSKSDLVENGIPYINAGDIDTGIVKIDSCNRITRDKYCSLGGAKIRRYDVIYCLRGSIGKNAYIDNFDEGTVASSLCVIRAKQELMPKYMKEQTINDEQVEGIDTETGLLNQKRISAIVKYMLDHYNQKTRRNISDATYTIKRKDKSGQTVGTAHVSGFNSILATQSIKAAICYYKESKRQIEDRKEDLKIGMIYCYNPNEADPDEETFEVDGMVSRCSSFW